MPQPATTTTIRTPADRDKRARDPTLPAHGHSEAQPQIFPASEARANFMEVISRVRFGRERLVVTNKGKPAAAIVTLEDLKLLQLLDDVDIKEKLHVALANEESIPWEDFKQTLSNSSDR